MMEVVATPAVSSELFQFWKQLALAGLIEGSYSGLSGTAAGGYDVVLGTNIPASRLSSGGWSTNYFTGGTAGAIFNIRYENTLYFGAAASNLSTGNILKPEEAWNIDLKLDDGKAGRGKVIARSISTCTDASDMNDLDASYLLTSSSIACALLFGQAF